MFNEFLEIFKEAIPLIQEAESLPGGGAEKKQSVVDGLKKLLDKAPSIPDSFKRPEFLGEVIDFLVAVGNLPSKKSTAIDVAKEGLDVIVSFFRKDGE